MAMITPTTHRIAAVVTLLCCLPPALADPPPGYYESVDTSNSTTLRTTLHAVIDDHTRFHYTNGSPNTWDILELADEDPSNADIILVVEDGRIVECEKEFCVAKQRNGPIGKTTLVFLKHIPGFEEKDFQSAETIP